MPKGIYICSGVFTWSTLNSVNLLDYVLVDQVASKRVNCMIIDELNVMVSHSDHSLVLVELDLGVGDQSAVEQTQDQIASPTAKNVANFRIELDQLLEETDWDTLSTEEKCTLLQAALVEAARRVDSWVKIRKGTCSFSPKWLRRLQTKA